MTPRAVGSESERTVLAWQRTCLGVLAVGGLLGHRALVDGSSVQLVVAGVAALMGLGLLGGLGPVRYRLALRRLPAPRVLAVATGAVVLVDLAVAVAILAPR